MTSTSRSLLNSLPSIQQPIAGSGGTIQQPWLQFLASLVAAPGPIVTVTPTGSPFSYEASQNGALAISGGTVSSIKLTRARVTATLGATAGLFVMAQGDVITVTYSGAPAIKFIPE